MSDNKTWKKAGVTVRNHLSPQYDAAISRQVDLSISAIEDTLRSLLITLDKSANDPSRLCCAVSAVLANGASLTFDIEHASPESAVRDALERVRREARRSRALRTAS